MPKKTSKKEEKSSWFDRVEVVPYLLKCERNRWMRFQADFGKLEEVTVTIGDPPKEKINLKGPIYWDEELHENDQLPYYSLEVFMLFMQNNGIPHDGYVDCELRATNYLITDRDGRDKELTKVELRSTDYTNDG